MEYNKSVSNPMLMGAIELMKAEPTDAHRKMVSDEIQKAHFLSPATITPEPESGATKLGPGSHVQIPVLAAPNGRQYFMAFTDMAELKKWRDEEGVQTLSMSFDDYAAMLFKKDQQGNVNPTAGIVINPFGINIVVPKESFAQYISAKVAKATGATKSPDVQK